MEMQLVNSKVGPAPRRASPRWRLVCLALAFAVVGPAVLAAPDRSGVPEQAPGELDAFRDAVLAYVRETARRHLDGDAPQSAAALHYPGHWQLSVSIYHRGRKVGVADADADHLDRALGQAVVRALRRGKRPVLEPSSLPQARFLVSFEYPPGRWYAFIEYQDEGRELVGEVVAVRRLTISRVQAQVAAAIDYLLRAVQRPLHGLAKKYDVRENSFERQLRTIYTASTLYTLLRSTDLSPDEDVEAHVRPIADFILSMQQDGGDHSGAFHYAYHPQEGRKEERFPVGTTAKTILTLLELHRRLDDDRYLDAAVRGGNWLLRMQGADGTLPSQADTGSGTDTPPGRFSIFYNSQVLSALSRLYQVTLSERFLTGATSIAHRLLQSTEEQGALLVDDVRGKVGSITTSWVVMALLDYARAVDDDSLLDTVFRSADAVLARQLGNAADIYNHGRFSDTSTTSGNGWISEVMVQVYLNCVAHRGPDCGRYRESVVLVSRWLIQNTYDDANTFHIPEPANAIGGLMRNPREESVRTDAVCHAANGLMGLLEIADRDVLLSLPEPPLEAVLNQLRLGRGKYHPILAPAGAGRGWGR